MLRLPAHQDVSGVLGFSWNDMTAYYNENDPYAAQWLRNLIDAGQIAPGVVDERSITEVQPDELAGFTQVHWFAGIGGWSAALRLAGWPDEASVWTGSCPCQPFSEAGKQRGTDDERHLWPEFRRLIAECQPAVVFGEQVESKAGRAWFSGVRADLEALGYGVGAADLCAASTGTELEEGIGPALRDMVADSHGCAAADEFWEWWLDSGLFAQHDCLAGSPHIRQRLFWVADATSGRLTECRNAAQSRRGGHVDRCGEIDGLPDAEHTTGSSERLDDSRERTAAGPHDGAVSRDDRGDDGRLGDADSERFSWRPERDVIEEAGVESSLGANALRSDSWSDYRIVQCRDGKARRVGPATSVLAPRLSGRVAVRRTTGQTEEEHWYNRVGALKGLGNAIVPQVAAAFIEAFCEVSG